MFNFNPIPLQARGIRFVGNRLLIALFAALALPPPSAIASNVFWDGTGTGWNTVSDWSTANNATTPDPASPPGAADGAFFNITTVNTAQIVNLNANQSALGLVFSSTGTVSIQTGSGTNALTIGTSGIIVNSGAAADSITAGVVLNGNQSWINNAVNTFTVSGAISGSGNLSKSGTGQVTLSNGTNSYSGTTTISQGTLLAGAANVIPSTSAVTDNSTFNLGGFAQSIGSLTGTGTVTTTGASGSDTLTVGNDNTSPAAFTGSITNAGSGRQVALTKNGTGTLTLGGTSTFTGLLTVNGGTLELSSSGVISAAGTTNIGTGVASTFTLDGGSSSFSQFGSSGVIVGNTGTLAGTINIGTVSNGAVFSTGTGAMTINKTGTVNIGSGVITGTLNANGNVTIDGGVLARAIAGTFTLATGKTMAVQSGGRASFTGDYSTANATYNISGSGSKLETLSTGANGDFRVINGAQVNVSLGGLLAAGRFLDPPPF